MNSSNHLFHRTRLALRSLALATALAASVLVPASVARAEKFDRADLRRIESRVQTVAEKAMPAVVVITHRAAGKGMASGTGSIVTPEGLIVTAAHVVRGSDKVDITLIDGSTRTAKVLGSDYARDVALAQINEPGPYPFIKLGNSKNLKPGDLIVALGHAGGWDEKRKPPVRFGRIFDTNLRGFLRSDCTLVGGDSGGPSLDLDGNLVGVHSWVSADISMNSDAPIDAVREAWDRMLAGERWGKPIDMAPEMPKIPAEELAGLDIKKFRDRMMRAAAGGGQVATTPATLRKWLTESGMNADRVKGMSDQQIGAFVGRVMGGVAEVKPGAGGTPTPAELAGMDVAKFKAKIAESAKDGKLTVTPQQLRKLFTESGMDAKHADGLNDQATVGLMSRLMNGAATAQPKPSTQPTDDLAGLNLQKFKTRFADGKTLGSAVQARNALLEDGMSASRLSNMSDFELGMLVQRLSKDPDRTAVANAPSTEKPTTRPSTQPAKPDVAAAPAGVDLKKLGEILSAKAAASGGKLTVNPSVARDVLKEAGLAADKLKAMSDQDVVRTLLQAMQGSGAGLRAAMPNQAVNRAITDMDRAILKTVSGDLKAAVPSVVEFWSADKQIAVGTVIRADGFILTKKSEVIEAKDKLEARLADGRKLAAKIVKTFDEHDLAMVHVAADNLTPAKLDGSAVAKAYAELRPGSLVFAPSNSAETPMLAMGAMSVPERSLRDEGGYLGMLLGEKDGKVICESPAPNGPAQKAGFRNGDVILSLNGETFTKSADFSKAIRKLPAGSKAKIVYKRGEEEEKTAEVTLGDRLSLPTRDDGRARNQPGTVVSKVRSGFPQIFQHDVPLKPEECGGPILNLDGVVVGLNIARGGRIETYAIPAPVVAKLLAKTDFDAINNKDDKKVEERTKSEK